MTKTRASSAFSQSQGLQKLYKSVSHCRKRSRKVSLLHLAPRISLLSALLSASLDTFSLPVCLLGKRRSWFGLTLHHAAAFLIGQAATLPTRYHLPISFATRTPLVLNTRPLPPPPTLHRSHTFHPASSRCKRPILLLPPPNNLAKFFAQSNRRVFETCPNPRPLSLPLLTRYFADFVLLRLTLKPLIIIAATTTSAKVAATAATVSLSYCRPLFFLSSGG